MAETTALQRKWRFQVNLGTAGAPDWTTVVGLQEFNPVVSPVDQEDDDYESDGWQGDTRTARKWGVTGNISYRQDSETFVPNAAHESLRIAGSAIGTDAERHIRWFDRFGGPEAWEGYGLVTWEPAGGGMTDLQRVGITLGPSSTSPALVAIPNPVAETPDPVITGVDPTTGGAAGGTLITITGAHFTGATSVTVDGDPVESYTVISPTKIAAVTPAGDAGVVDVAVTTPNGTATATNVFTYTA